MSLNFPPEQPRPFLHKAGIRLINQTILDGHLPEEAAQSFPIPLNDGLRVAYFQYLFLSAADNNIWAARLLTHVEIKLLPENPDMIEVQTLKFVKQGEGFFDLPDYVELAPVDRPPRTQRLQLEAALYVSATRLLNIGYEDVPLDEAKQTFKNVLHTLSYPELLSYYRVLNPQFAEEIGL